MVAPLVLFLQMLCKILFKKLFADGQRYMNKIERSIFKIWNFLPLFQMLFLWQKQKLPLNEILLLAFKRVLQIFEDSRTFSPFEHNKI
jgi:hypothetical protein